MTNYEMRVEARRERLERAAEKAEQESTARYEASSAAIAGIPFGQPILVGHHSEGGHRAAIRRSNNAMRASIIAGNRATRLAAMADAVGTAGIASDDPEAIAKLAEKRTELEIQRDHMKTINAHFRKHKTLDGIGAGVPAEMVTKAKGNLAVWERLGYQKDKPFPPYELTNIGARIRQAAQRAKDVGVTQAIPASEEEIGGATVTVDPDEGRVLIAFAARLPKEQYEIVRSMGFVWAPTRKAFVRKLTSHAVWQAKRAAAAIGALAITQGIVDA